MKLSRVLLLSFTVSLKMLADWSDEQRMELIRGLASEWATAKVPIPRSKKPLAVAADGTFDKKAWNDIGRSEGAAARLGDILQITKVELEGDQIKFELNGGSKRKGAWKERVQIGGMGGNVPLSTGAPQTAPSGTNLILRFDKTKPPQDSATVKKMLQGVLSFERRTATEQYVDRLPPEQKKAVEEKRIMEGMQKEAVILSWGKPVRKFRDSKDGEDTEDWQYGVPPGKVVFVQFKEDVVTRVKEMYGNIGGSTVPNLPTPK
jgi:hypothetical protein